MKQGKLHKIFDNVLKILGVSGIRLSIPDLPNETAQSHFYECENLETAITTAVENLQRIGLKVFTSNAGDFFTIKVLSIIGSGSNTYKIYYIFAFEYGQRTRGLDNDPVVVVTMKIRKD